MHYLHRLGPLLLGEEFPPHCHLTVATLMTFEGLWLLQLQRGPQRMFRGREFTAGAKTSLAQHLQYIIGTFSAPIVLYS